MDIINGVTDRCIDCVFPCVQDRLKKNISEMLIPQMNMDYTPSELIKQKLIDKISSRFMNALVKEHEPVGVSAALTTGENLIQQSLGSHHYAGLKRGAVGFERIEEITKLTAVNDIKVILKPLDENDDIYGIPRAADDIYRLCNSLIGYTLDKCMDQRKKYRVLNINDTEVAKNSSYTLLQVYNTLNPVAINNIIAEQGEDIESINELLEQPITNDEFESSRLSYFPPWYRMAINIPRTRNTGEQAPIYESFLRSTFLRVYINPMILYKTQTTLQQIANNIMMTNKAKDLVIIYPPIAVGCFLDIHLSMIETKTSVFYNMMGTIADICVSGISSIETVFPISENLLSDIKISLVSEGDAKNIYNISSNIPNFIPIYAIFYMIRTMIPDAEYVSNTSFKSKYSYNDVQKMILQCPLMYADIIDDRYTKDNTTFITFKTNLIKDYPYLLYADLQPRKFITNNRSTSDVQADEFLLQYMVDHHLYWYIEGKCSNIHDIFMMPEVDPRYTFTLNPEDCISNLGYLAMRNILYQELRDNIKIDSSHLKLIANNITLYDTPIAIDRNSIKNDKTEILTYATYEEVNKYIVTSAFVGAVDHCTSVSAKVLTGQKILIGRGGDILTKPNSYLLALEKFNKSKK